MEEILRLFSPKLRQAIEKKIVNRWDELEELRVRLLRPVELIFNNGSEWLPHSIPTEDDGLFLISQLSEFSLYRMEDELREGYITIEGGHRVGLAGKVNTRNGEIKSVHYITFFNIRIAKAKAGAGMALLPYIFRKNYMNTLLIGPPQSGKTTMIRDLVRSISTG